MTTGLSIDWSKIISTDQSNLRVRCISSVVTGLSIDNSNFFIRQSILILVVSACLCFRLFGWAVSWFRGLVIHSEFDFIVFCECFRDH